MPRTVYVITASQGEYSDRREWAVTGFLDEEKAKERVEALSAEQRVLIQKSENNERLFWQERARILKSELPDEEKKEVLYEIATALRRDHHEEIFYYLGPLEIEDWQ